MFKLIIFAAVMVNLSCNSESSKMLPTGKQPAESDTVSDTLYLSLFCVRENEVTKKSEGEILIFGKYANGNFIEVFDYDEKEAKPIAERRQILSAHKKFTIYYEGKVISNSQVISIDSSEYDCETLTIGRCENNINIKILSDRANEYTQSRSGTNGGEVVAYSLTNFLALSNDMPEPQNPVFQRQHLDSIQLSHIDEYLLK
jgi:hypothetical protein